MRVPFRPLLGRVKRAIIPPRRIPAQTLRRALFRFGFICYATADSPAARHPDWRMVQTNWRRIAVDQFTLYAHPETRIARHTDNGQETVLLGDCFSASSACVTDPLSMLAAAGADEIAGVLHELSGRFALITVRNGQARFWHDPFASRTIYYRDGGAFGVASHDELLAVAFGNRRRADMAAFLRSAWFDAMPMAHLPGGATLFDGLRILPANHAYDATQRRPVRYWPVQERRRGSHQEFFAAMDT